MKGKQDYNAMIVASDKEMTSEHRQAPLQIMPVLSARQFLDRRKAMFEMLKEVMIEGVDYGTIPGTPKPTLYKPGAEKLLQMFGLTVQCMPVEIIEQWGDDTAEAFLYYKYEAIIRYGATPIVCYTGICHSRETKYRYRWVPEHEVPKYLDKSTLDCRVGKASEYDFAVRKGETIGKYGKPAEHWQAFKDAISDGTARRFKKPMGQKQVDAWEIDLSVYRIPNPETPDLAHTLSAMSQKRAIVGGTRYATNASDVFEVSELADEGDLVIDGSYSYVDEQEKEREAEQLRKATTGSGKKNTKAQAAKDKDDLFGDGPQAAIKQIRAAFDAASQEEQNRPPDESSVMQLTERITALDLKVEQVSKVIFRKDFSALSEGHITALASATDDVIVGAMS